MKTHKRHKRHKRHKSEFTPPPTFQTHTNTYVSNQSPHQCVNTDMVVSSAPGSFVENISTKKTNALVQQYK